MNTFELFCSLQKMKFFMKYGNKAVMGCGRIIADIEVDCKCIGRVILEMVNETLHLTFLGDSYLDETHHVVSVEDAIARFTALISSPNIRR